MASAQRSCFRASAAPTLSPNSRSPQSVQPSRAVMHRSQQLRLRVPVDHQNRTSASPTPAKENQCTQIRSFRTLWESRRFKSGGNRFKTNSLLSRRRTGFPGLLDSGRVSALSLEYATRSAAVPVWPGPEGPCSVTRRSHVRSRTLTRRLDDGVRLRSPTSPSAHRSTLRSSSLLTMPHHRRIILRRLGALMHRVVARDLEGLAVCRIVRRDGGVLGHDEILFVAVDALE